MSTQIAPLFHELRGFADTVDSFRLACLFFPMDVSLIDSRLCDEQRLVFDFIFSQGVGAFQNSGKLYAILLMMVT